MNTEQQQLDELLGSALRAANAVGMRFGRAVNTGADRFAGALTRTTSPTLGRMSNAAPGRLASRIIQPGPARTPTMKQAKSIYAKLNPQQQEMIRRKAADILKQRQMRNPTASGQDLLARTAERTDRFKAQQKQGAINRYKSMNPAQQANVRAKMVSILQKRDPEKYADVIKRAGSDSATKQALLTSRIQSLYKTGGAQVSTTKAPTTTPTTAKPDAFSALSSLSQQGRTGIAAALAARSAQRQRVSQLYPTKAKPVFARRY